MLPVCAESSCTVDLIISVTDLVVVFSMKFSLVALSGLATVALAAPTASGTVHEKRDVDGHRWTKRDALDADHVIPVLIALKQCNLENGMDYLLGVYVILCINCVQSLTHYP